MGAKGIMINATAAIMILVTTTPLGDIDIKFKKLGYCRLKVDPNLYIFMFKNGCFILLYMNDMLLIKFINEILNIKQIILCLYKMKNLGPVTLFLDI